MAARINQDAATRELMPSLIMKASLGRAAAAYAVGHRNPFDGAEITTIDDSLQCHDIRKKAPVHVDGTRQFSLRRQRHEFFSFNTSDGERLLNEGMPSIRQRVFRLRVVKRIRRSNEDGVHVI